MSETHRLIIKLKKRDGSSTETELESFEKEFPVLEPQKLTKRINQADGLVDMNLPDVPFQYVLIRATYAEDDGAIGVVKGDPAPIKCRFDGVVTDKILPEGIDVWTGDLAQLQIATDYATNKILVEVYLG